MNVDWRHPPGPATGGEDAPADPAFPLRRALLDSGLVAAAVTASVAAAGTDAASAVGGAPGQRLMDVYYYPGRTLQAVHRLGNGVVTLHAAAGGVRPTMQSGDVWLPDLRAVVRAFPADPSLPTLGTVCSELGPGPELLTYLPGLRAVLGDSFRVAKVRTPKQTELAHERQLLMWSSPARRFRMARPLAADPAGGVRWERRVAGRGVDGSLRGASGAWLAEALADGLHRLHSLDPRAAAWRALPDLPPDRLLVRLETKTVRAIGRALPALAPRSASLAGRLRATMPSSEPTAAVHGDFHLANLLVDDRGLVLLDLDDMARGDAELDLALFSSRLLLVGLHRGDDLADRAALVQSLLVAYGAARGHPVDPGRFAWYLGYCLVGRQVKTAISHLAPELAALVERLLTIAEQTLDTGRFDAEAVTAVRRVAA